MSSLSIGIVGLPNVGKSTLFRALTSVAVPAENYPFCTIDPNVGVVEIPDPRLWRLAELVKPGQVTPAVVEFVDIAGLVRGAAEGEGLGNRFLQHIREVDAIAHVLRGFQDPSVAHVEAHADPVADRETVETELALADLESVTRGIDRAERRARSGDPEAAAMVDLLRRVEGHLAKGDPARRAALDADERRLLRSFGLLTLKPVLYVVNVDEAEAGGSPAAERFTATLMASDPETQVVSLSARLEAEFAELGPEERPEYLAAHGLTESGLERLVRAGYRLLGLQTFFTVGDNEVRAWTVRVGARAPEAAGRIHTDFARGFIRAETLHYDEFMRAGSLKTARERGTLRSEGREYVVVDGDVILFRAAT